MHLEAEVYDLLIGAYVAIAFTAAAVLFFLYRKAKRPALHWFSAQLILQTVAFRYFHQCISYRPDFSYAYTATQSLTIGLAGMFWAASIICMLVGIYKLTTK